MSAAESKQSTAALPLIQYWHESDPPQNVVETLASFREHNPGMEQLVFDEATASAFIEAHLGGREVAAYRACAVPAMQADYFRYCAVHALGGIYADANFRCVGCLGTLLEGDEGGFFFGRQDPVPPDLAAMYNWRHAVGSFRVITNGMFGFREAGHPLLRLAVRVATANLEHRVADGPIGIWIATGPGVLTSLYLLHQLGSIDAFIEYSIDSVIESSAPLLCEVVDDYTQLSQMWEGIGIRPLAQRAAWGDEAGKRLGGVRWRSVTDSIYREPGDIDDLG